MSNFSKCIFHNVNLIKVKSNRQQDETPFRRRIRKVKLDGTEF